MKRRTNKHRSKDMHSNEAERKQNHKCSDKFEKNSEKYGAVAVLLNQETEDEFIDEMDED